MPPRGGEAHYKVTCERRLANSGSIIMPFRVQIWPEPVNHFLRRRRTRKSITQYLDRCNIG